MRRAQSEWSVLEEVWAGQARALGGLARSLDRGAVLRCVDVLARCKGRILVTGAGTSGAAARKIAHSLCCVGRPSFFLSPADAPHGALGAVTGRDVVILLSKGGKTREINTMVEPLRAAGPFLVAVTGNRRSALARRADLALIVPLEAEADPYGLLATTSTLAVLALFDAVCVALMCRTGYSREEFARIHPGGAVGRRLARGSRSGGTPKDSTRGTPGRR